VIQKNYVSKYTSELTLFQFSHSELTGLILLYSEYYYTMFEIIIPEPFQHLSLFILHNKVARKHTKLVLETFCKIGRV
jgi:hypothetical protein